MSGRLSRLRDRWLSRPEARERLARLPFGRRIADAHARRLFGIVAGFAQSQMLAAAVELGLFDCLAEGACESRAVGGRIGLDSRGADALVSALLAMALIERRGDSLALTIDGWVVATDPGLRAMIRHNRLLYEDLTDPVALLRAPGSGRLGAFWPYRSSESRSAEYSALMADSLAMVADAVIAHVDFGRFDQVMDVGGGDGSFLRRIAERTDARLTLVDLPPVLDRARDRLGEAGLGARVALCSPAKDGSLPYGADAITLLRVLHDHDDDGALGLLVAAADALASGGRVIVAEPVAHAPPDPQAAYFAAYFAAMGSGKLRSTAQLYALLKRAGLEPAGRPERSLLCNVMQARHCKA